jgi:glycosyltransferase involved in cell wall biosynthesis
VASSQATALPDQVADAGLLFDPLDTAAIGAAIERLMTDDALCDDLRARGRRRLDDFDWTRTAKGYRAVYRRVAGRGLTDEDRRLLSWDWARFPERDGAEPAVESAR